MGTENYSTMVDAKNWDLIFKKCRTRGDSCFDQNPILKNFEKILHN